MTRLINQGGFGCIFYPGFNCSTNFKKNTKKLVSKVQLNHFNARNEIYIGSLIKEINNYRLYFLPVIDSCNLSLASIDSNIIDKCEIIEKNIDKYKVLELPYLENISFNRLFSDTQRTTQHLFLTFIETYKYLVISIHELIKKNIVHFDIKEQNILYSNKYENPILIDFGLSIPIDKLSNTNFKDYFYVYAPDYSLWPLEVHIINYILHNGTLTKNAIDITIETYLSNLSAFSSLSDEFKLDYKTSASNFFYKYLKFDLSDIIRQLLEYNKTWDLYSLSVMYLKFLNKLFHKGYFENSFIINFSQLILQNLSPIPDNRFSPIDTLKSYTNIFFIKEVPENYFILIKELEKDTIINQ
jgi:serine/threonine protein kinase